MSQITVSIHKDEMQKQGFNKQMDAAGIAGREGLNKQMDAAGAQAGAAGREGLIEAIYAEKNDEELLRKLLHQAITDDIIDDILLIMIIDMITLNQGTYGTDIKFMSEIIDAAKMPIPGAMSTLCDKSMSNYKFNNMLQFYAMIADRGEPMNPEHIKKILSRLSTTTTLSKYITRDETKIKILTYMTSFGLGTHEHDTLFEWEGILPLINLSTMYPFANNPMHHNALVCLLFKMSNGQLIKICRDFIRFDSIILYTKFMKHLEYMSKNYEIKVSLIKGMIPFPQDIKLITNDNPPEYVSAQSSNLMNTNQLPAYPKYIEHEVLCIDELVSEKQKVHDSSKSRKCFIL